MDVEKIRREKFFYDLSADVALRFPDGKSLCVNKSVLAYHLKNFQEAFFDAVGSPKEIACMKISDCEAKQFKAFLDCLLGLRKISTDNVLAVYPMAEKYELKEMKKKCMNLMIPKEINEHTVKCLNFAVKHNLLELEDACLEIMRSRGVKSAFEDDDLCFLFEPKAVRALIDNSGFDKRLIERLLFWAEYYAETHPRLGSLKQVLEKFGILDKMSEWYLEYDDPTDFIHFYKNSKLKRLYTDADIFGYCNMMWKNAKKKIIHQQMNQEHEHEPVEM